MLTSLQNPLVKQMRKLHRTRERQQQRLLLLEGTHLLQEACAAQIPLGTLCGTPEWIQGHEQLWAQASQTAQRSELVSPEVLQAIATTVHPDGVVATVEQSHVHTHGTQFTSLGVVLETIQDPGNLGTIIRTTSAAGAEGLLLSSDSVDPNNPKVLRASAGQWFRLPIAVSLDLKTDLSHYQSQGMQIVATVPTTEQTYWQVDWQKPSLILLGNEGAGLSSDLLELADCQVTIPLTPGVESLNVAIACALILYEAKRQRVNR